MKLKHYTNTIRNSSFHMNALYLMLSTFVLAGAGFIFWVIITHSYDTTAVGVATTLLSVSGLLSLLGLAGFDTTFVRFLPRTERRNEYINSGFIVVIAITSLFATLTALYLPYISPELAVLKQPGFALGFVFFTVVNSLVVLINAIFLAYKSVKYTFIINILFGIVKILLPVIIARGNETTIFLLAGGAQLIGLSLGVTWLRQLFNYRFLFSIDKKALRQVRKFSSSVYASSILNLLPPTLLPLIITSLLGPENAAYYYMAFTIAGVLYTIAYASMQSVFAEGSHDEASLHAHITKASKLIALLLVPAALFIATISGFLLGIFGQSYAQNSSQLLQIFALSALPVAIYSALGAIFKVTKNLRGVVAMNIIYAGTILGGSYVLLPLFGISAIGWGWLAGNIMACIVGTLFLSNKKGGKYGEVTTARR